MYGGICLSIIEVKEKFEHFITIVVVIVIILSVLQCFDAVTVQLDNRKGGSVKMWYSDHKDFSWNVA